MNPLDFTEAISQVVAKDGRYAPAAYDFVREALGVAVGHFQNSKEDQHVTGQQLLEGVRLHALNEFGPMAHATLAIWGIHRGEDVGNIVYNLIDVGYFGRNDGDSLEDFAGGYDFDEAFVLPFEPEAVQQQRKSRTQ